MDDAVDDDYSDSDKDTVAVTHTCSILQTRIKETYAYWVSDSLLYIWKRRTPV